MAAQRKASSPQQTEGKQILNSVRRLVRALRLFDREAQSKHGISAAQMFVLHTLKEEDGISLNDLAERTATDQSSASVVVQRLVDAGYVTRTTRKDDRRHVELRLTASGRAVIRRSPPPAQQKILAAVGAMKAKDRKAFAALLEAFVDEFGVRGPKSPMLFEEDPPRRPASRRVDESTSRRGTKRSRRVDSSTRRWSSTMMQRSGSWSRGSSRGTASGSRSLATAPRGSKCLPSATTT